jgi:hypothetical protein
MIVAPKGSSTSSPPRATHGRGGVAGFGMANRSLSSGSGGEGEIRQDIVKTTWWIAWSRCQRTFN